MRKCNKNESKGEREIRGKMGKEKCKERGKEYELERGEERKPFGERDIK